MKIFLFFSNLQKKLIQNLFFITLEIFSTFDTLNYSTMRNLLIAFLLLIIASSCKPKPSKYEEINNPLTSNYQDAIKLFQNKLNTQYASTKESPLTTEDLKTFKALDFFEIDKNFRVEASLELTPNSPIFEMQTTTERKPLYKKY